MVTKKIYFYSMCLLLSCINYLYQYSLIENIGLISNTNILYINMVVGFFILGLGCGTYFCEQLNLKNPLQALKYAELSLAVVAIISISLYQQSLLYNAELRNFFLENITQQKNIQKILVYIFQNSLIPSSILWASSFTIGIFSGCELPLLIKINENNNLNITPNRILGITYFGSILSSILLIFILKTFLNYQNVLFYNIALNIFAIFLLQILNFDWKSVLGSLIITYLSITAYQRFEITHIKYLQAYYKSNKDKNAQIEEIITPYQTIHKTTLENETIVFLNHKYQFRTNVEKIYHESMVHIPIIVTESIPKNVLLLGAGDGFLLRELRKYPDMLIDHVELDESFQIFSKNDKDIAQANEYSLDWYKDTQFQDGFQMIQNNNKKYDFIIIDFPYPHTKDLAKLYSFEFLTFVQRSLSKEGFFVMDVPIKNTRKQKLFPFKNNGDHKNNLIVYNTFKSLNFKYLEFYSLDSEGFVLGSNHKTNMNEVFNSKKQLLLTKQTINRLNTIKNEHFNFEDNPKYINSIFNLQKFEFID